MIGRRDFLKGMCAALPLGILADADILDLYMMGVLPSLKREDRMLSYKQMGSVLIASDAELEDAFGTSVAISSDGLVLAVGAIAWDGAGGDDQGGVYIYDKNGDSWTQRGSVLTASDAGTTDLFGCAVSLSSDGRVLIVGAYGWDGPAGADQGGVYGYCQYWAGKIHGIQPAKIIIGDEAIPVENIRRVIIGDQEI